MSVNFRISLRPIREASVTIESLHAGQRNMHRMPNGAVAASVMPNVAETATTPARRLTSGRPASHGRDMTR